MSSPIKNLESIFEKLSIDPIKKLIVEPIKATKVVKTAKITKPIKKLVVEPIKATKVVKTAKKPKGSLCSKKGKEYENKVYNVCSKIKFKNSNVPFCTNDNLAGSSANIDIVCNFDNFDNLDNLDNKKETISEIGIEIKKCNAPDWTQLSITFKDEMWRSKGRNKIPNKSREIIEEIINDKKIFNNKIPPFVNNKIKHSEWLEIKKKNEDFKDCYFECDEDTIARLYKAKKCYYIQVSDKGLYHTGEDICNFGVPYFKCKQRLRVRTKIHKKANKQGYMNASVTAAIQPVKVKRKFVNLEKSNYSLDDFAKIPTNLILL